MSVRAIVLSLASCTVTCCGEVFTVVPWRLAAVKLVCSFGRVTAMAEVATRIFRGFLNCWRKCYAAYCFGPPCQACRPDWMVGSDLVAVKAS